MFRVSLAVLVIFMGCGVSGHIFEKLMRMTMNLAITEINEEIKNPHRSVDDFGKSVGQSVMMATGLLSTERSKSKKFDQIYKAITDLSKQISELQDYLHGKLDNLLIEFRQMVNSAVRYELRIDFLVENMQLIEQKYETFLTILENYLSPNISSKRRFTTKTVLNFAQQMIANSKGGLRNSIVHMYSTVCKTNFAASMDVDGALLLMARDMAMQNATLCGHQSPQQKLYEAFKTISVVDLKGFIITRYSFDLLDLIGNDTYFPNVRLKQSVDFIQRRSCYAAAINVALMYSNRYLRACSPSTYNRGENYIELEGLYGPYIINELDMDIKYKLEALDHYRKEDDKLDAVSHAGDWISMFLPSSATEKPTPLNLECIESNCADLQSKSNAIRQKAKYPGYGLFSNKEGLRCHGNIVSCVSMGSTASFCHHPDPTKRYGYINTVMGTYGEQRQCQSRRNFVRASPFRFEINSQCEYCLCQCQNSDDNSPNVVKWINMNDHISDIHNNMAIVGLKFEKNGNKIEIKIKQGKVETSGEVSGSSWTSGFSGKADYMEIGELDTKSLVLVHYEAKKDHVLTGIRFRRYFDKYFGIQIHSTKIDFDTGKLSPHESGWKDIINRNDLGEELRLERPDIPTQSPEDDLDFKDRQYVTFTVSDLGKTAGAYVVPFIDSEPVETNPEFVLNGAGMIHKGSRGYGGFVAFRLSTYQLLLKAPYPDITIPKRLIHE